MGIQPNRRFLARRGPPAETTVGGEARRWSVNQPIPAEAWLETTTGQRAWALLQQTATFRSAAKLGKEARGQRALNLSQIENH